MGSAPLSVMYFSIRRRSYTHPDTGDTTGCSGTSLLTEKYKILMFKAFIFLIVTS